MNYCKPNTQRVHFLASISEWSSLYKVIFFHHISLSVIFFICSWTLPTPHHCLFSMVLKLQISHLNVILHMTVDPFLSFQPKFGLLSAWEWKLIQLGSTNRTNCKLSIFHGSLFLMNHDIHVCRTVFFLFILSSASLMPRFYHTHMRYQKIYITIPQSQFIFYSIH